MEWGVFFNFIVGTVVGALLAIIFIIIWVLHSVNKGG